MDTKEIEKLAEEKYCRSGYGTWDENKLHHRVRGFVEGFQSAEATLFSKEDNPLLGKMADLLKRAQSQIGLEWSEEEELGIDIKIVLSEYSEYLKQKS